MVQDCSNTNIFPSIRFKVSDIVFYLASVLNSLSGKKTSFRLLEVLLMVRDFNVKIYFLW